MSLFYLFTVMFGFAFWSILDVVDSRRLVNVVTCIISCIGSGIFWNGFFEMPEYIMVEHAVDRSLSCEQTLCRFV